MIPACGDSTASTRPRGTTSTSARYPSTSRASAPGDAGYHVPATAAGLLISGTILPMPDKLTRADVQRIAALARLDLSDAELTLFAHQLGEILTHAEQLQRVDTSGVAPTAHIAVPSALAPLREDDPRPSLDRDMLLSQAPDADRARGLLKVPRVLGS